MQISHLILTFVAATATVASPTGSTTQGDVDPVIAKYGLTDDVTDSTAEAKLSKRAEKCYKDDWRWDTEKDYALDRAGRWCSGNGGSGHYIKGQVKYGCYNLNSVKRINFKIQNLQDRDISLSSAACYRFLRGIINKCDRGGENGNGAWWWVLSLGRWLKCLVLDQSKPFQIGKDSDSPHGGPADNDATLASSCILPLQPKSDMRLVNTHKIELEFVDDDKVPEYAILSHTWEQEEILFQDMGLESAQTKKGYAKLESCCRVARDNGFDYIWDDTCCIDKTSSAELSEAINSMYRYYEEADICYAYLADVSTISDVSNSRWFTRGWTLQELIAPHEIIFFDKQWRQLGTKSSLVDVITDRTSIPASILCDSEQLETTSIAQRMSWAADRVTTRKEDRAYSLMGIFGINMPLLYGEGEKAFYRLQEEIMRVSDDHSLFAWKYSGARGGLLAPTPSAFKDSGAIIPWNPFTPYNSPFTMTNKGVHMDAPFIALDTSGHGLCVLHCTNIGQRDKLIAIHLRDAYFTMEHFERCMTDEFHWVNLNNFNLTQYPVRSLCIRSQAQTIARRSRRNERVADAPTNKIAAAPSPKSDLSLSDAAFSGDEGTVWFLLAQTDARSTSALGNLAQSAMCLAARGGHERLVSQLMTRRDTSNFFMDSERRTVLSHAAECGQVYVVKLILSNARVHPDARDVHDLSALWYAVKNGHAASARLLLQTGLVRASVGGSGDTKSALWHATSAGDFHLVKLLLEHKALEDEAGESALSAAVANGYSTIVELLLKHGADTEGLDSQKRTPLQVACMDNNHEIVLFLLKYGANADRRDSSGKTPLAWAALRGNAVLARLLLENGANPRAMFEWENSSGLC
ncbi:hypothetical protein F53441_286 [Fusarium austroafricanum]|uniref:Heterokaryon incompatibility domain-containing protein n=1 Tax=Fusarium austroafricanum TaxID=2364996 RepID=A0A8H4KYV2_9HYPO|nr:hypothetical protein F53441_286 [Fusarium austroafricanum]